MAFLTALGLLAVYIWMRDLSSITSVEDTLPILLSLPLFVYMGWPWRFRSEPERPSYTGLTASTALFLLGIALDLAVLLALSWTYMLWIWISSRIAEGDLPCLRKLMILPFLSLPWINIEGDLIGWHFRLSGAWVTAKAFAAMGFNVVHQGTQLMVQGLPVGIGEACSGINVLQSMLIAGSALTYLNLGKTRRYWVNLMALVIIAWIANTLRIFVLCISALSLGREFALGLFHTWGGGLSLSLCCS
jgi:exosortase